MPAPPERPSFATGFRCLFGGIAYVLSTPAVWPLAMVPLAMAVGVSIGLGIGAYSYVPLFVEQLVGTPSGWLAVIGLWLLKLLATLLAFVLAALIASAIAQPLSGPALEKIVRQRENALGLPARPEVGFMVDVYRSLKSTGVGLAVGTPPLVVLFLLSLVLPAGPILLFPFEIMVAAFTIAWDLCDYPLSVKGQGVGKRVATVWAYRSAVFGFAVPLALAALLPCLLFLMLPMGVAGATQLMVEVERHQAHTNPPQPQSN